jgi:chromosome segregation protein
VYLKSLTLRGFKSFASATSLRFEPGITCIVGPNGSGKSNVVDAFSWVMGEQGVKPLRGGKMEDVVFAGTSARPPLGRAEVTLTIDNSDGTLPIDYAEVTISRLLFRSGQSEYSINGSQCRLLDVQELLSDTGLGREMHVIVSQGQLDEVLNAGPEARRALIEEAAGVLKHRKRKEKALRKLEAMQANLTRLVDLTGELGRRLKPLGRQAEIARRAAVIQADLRDARLRLLADDYATVAAEMERGDAGEAAAAARRAELDQQLSAARTAEAELEAAGLRQAPRLAAAQEALFSLTRLAERLRGIEGLAAERHRHLCSAPEPARPERDPDELDAEADRLRERERELHGQLSQARQQLSGAVAGRTAAEAELAEAERRLAADARAAAQRVERLGRLRSQVGAARSRLTAAREESGRLAEAHRQALERAEQASADYAELQDLVAGREEGRAGLVAAHERAEEALAGASARVARLRAAEHQASENRSALRARVDALAEAVRQGADASGTLLSGPERQPGVLGPLAGLLEIADGAQGAVAAALGAAAGAVAVAGLDAAVAILDTLKRDGGGQAELVIANGWPERGDRPGLQRRPGRPEADGWAPDRVQYVLDLVKAPGELAGAIEQLLGGVLVAPDLRRGLELVREDPRRRVVTADGDLIGAYWARGGSAGGPGLLGLSAAAQEAADRLGEAEIRCDRAERDLADAIDEEERSRLDLAAAAAALQQADAAAAETSGRLGTLAGAARAAREEAGRLAVAMAVAQRAVEKGITALAEMEARLLAAEAGAQAGTAGDEVAGPREPGQHGQEAAGRPANGTDPAASRAALADAAAAARSREMEARLEVRTLEERLRAIAGRGESLAAAAAAQRQAAQREAARAERRQREAEVAAAVATAARYAVQRIAESVAAADAERRAAEAASSTRDADLKAVRSRIRELAADLDTVVTAAHAAEIARAEQRLRLDQIAARASEAFGVGPDALLAEYGPGVPVPASEEGRPPAAFDRGVQERRAQAAQRQLDQLGKVNPLALEEFAALQERHSFLVTQLEDLKKTRRDLLTVVREVDDRVQEVFASAYADTAREFEEIFARLFPGGTGRMLLTEPDDILTSGIDFEARPPGKKVRRLSLLSGGERALTAIAFLLAIFKARPSPFYVLDEVEAALDDTNLQRLLEIFEELRENSQLIVITHQKRTMEIADSLYGISMRGDGVSAVVSQRLRERETA